MPGQHLAYEMRLDLGEVDRGAIDLALSRLDRAGVRLTTLTTGFRTRREALQAYPLASTKPR